jgi:hypothetical protein
MAKSKWTRESFILAAETKFPGRFDYSQVVWKNVTTKVKIICKEHSEFEILPSNFFTQKQPCRNCTFKYRNIDYNNRKPRITTDIFVKKAIEKHGSEYDYSLTKYVDKKTKIKFECKKHGIQSQNPRQHLKNGCQYCNNRGISKHSRESFIAKAIKVHGDKYCYDKVDYIDIKKKVIVTCKIHGDFQIAPANHINSKQGCRACGYSKETQKILRNKRYIKLIKEKWKGKYDYKKTTYVDKVTHIVYDCPDHGEQKQNPIQHLRHGCQFCNGRVETKHTKETFINLAKKIHGDKYTYDKVIMNGMSNKITITCPSHGDFEQTGANHIHNKTGCPKCAAEMQVSGKEKQVSCFVQSIYDGEIRTSVRDIIPYNYEIDIYLPQLKIGIEFHGNFYHTESKVGKIRHLDKAELCEEKGIKLIQIFEHEWDLKNDIVCSRIKSAIGKSDKIFARKCDVVQVDPQEKDAFLKDNHIKGKDISRINFCLRYNGEIVACMTFGKPRFNDNYEWELIRYCSKIGINVIGGASRLLKAFRNKSSGTIISYADRRWSDGNLYKKLGFSFVNYTPVGYFYYNCSNKKIMSRIESQKQKIENVFPDFDPSLTERENMFKNGYERIYDAGNSVWVLRS